MYFPGQSDVEWAKPRKEQQTELDDVGIPHKHGRQTGVGGARFTPWILKFDITFE